MLTVSLAAAAACGGDTPSGPSGGADLALLSPVAQAGTAITLRLRTVPAGTMTVDGTLGAEAATFVRLDDSTIAGVLPDVPAGRHTLAITLPGVPGTAGTTRSLAFAVTAPEAIAAPAEVITASLSALEASLAVPGPAGVAPSTWTADSTALAQQFADARTAVQSLPAPEQLALARILRGIARDVAARVGPTGALHVAAIRSGAQAPTTLGPALSIRGQAGPSIETACRRTVGRWEEANITATGWVAGLKQSTLAVQGIIKIGAAAAFAKSFFEAAESQRYCMLPYAVQVEDVELSDAGTVFRLSAAFRTPTVADGETIPVARAYAAVRTRTITLADVLAANGNPLPAGMRLLPEPRESERSDIEPASVRLRYRYVRNVGTGPGASGRPANTAPATLSAAGGWLLLDARAHIPERVTAAVDVEIEYDDQWIAQELPLPVQRCQENNIWFRACSYRAEVHPPALARAPLAIGERRTLTAVVYDKENNVLDNRRVTWSVSSDGYHATLSGTEGPQTTVEGLRVTTPSVPTYVEARPRDALEEGMRGRAYFHVVEPCVIDGLVGTWTATEGSGYRPVGPWSPSTTHGFGPLPSWYGEVNVWSTVTASTLTVHPDLTYTMTMRWYQTERDGTGRYGAGGGVATGDVTTVWTGKVAVACVTRNGASVIEISPAQGVGQVTDNGGSASPVGPPFSYADGVRNWRYSPAARQLEWSAMFWPGVFRWQTVRATR